MGAGCVMVLTDPRAGTPRRRAAATTRRCGWSGSAPSRAAAPRPPCRPWPPILCDAFDVEAERRHGVEAETAASLANPAFTHYLVRVDGEPAAVARRATFDGASYLSSIGTASWARGRGLGELVTLAAAADAVAAESEWIYLGVFADNAAAIALYRNAGFEMVGRPAPDLLLVG